MARVIPVGLLLLLSTPFVSQVGTPTIALTNVNVVDVAEGRVLPAMTVVIARDRIAMVGPAQDVRLPDDARRVDASGKFLMPGLWDMHVHAFNDGRHTYVLPLLLANGITGVRDMGTNLPLDEVQRIIREVEQDRRSGPRFGAWTGRIVDGADSRLRIARPVATPADVRELVRSSKEQGASFIKPYDLLSPDVYRALADEAKRQKLPFAGHVPFSMSSADVSDLGQRSIEHTFDLLVSVASNESALRAARKPVEGNANVTRGREEIAAIDHYDERKAADLFARFARNGTWQCPTIVNLKATTAGTLAELAGSPRLNYIPASVRQDWNTTFTKSFQALGPMAARVRRFEQRVKITGEMYRAGVGLLAGTDAHGPFNVPGFTLHDELELFVRAGLAPQQALKTATLAAAQYLGREQGLGTVAPGKLADLVLLDANPLENISHTRRIAAVVANGRYLDRARLDVLLAEAEAAARAFVPPVQGGQ